MEKFHSEICGHLDIIATENEDEFEGKVEKWQEVSIHGDPEGLRSFAKLLVKLADFNQETANNLPIGAREHTGLRPNFDLTVRSNYVIIGRLDAKGTGDLT